MNNNKKQISDASLNNVYVALPQTATMALADPDLYRYWYNKENRIFWIKDEIDNDTLSIVDEIMEINIADKGIAIEDRKPIVLMINSQGGYVNIQQAVSHIIEISDTPVIGVGVGMVASAASQIYLSCHIRYIFPNAYFVLHQGSTIFEGSFAEVKAAMEDWEQTVETLTQEYIKKTNYTEQEIRDGLSIGHDWYVYAEEAIEKGLADGILENLAEIM